MAERLTKCPLCKSGLFLNYKEIVDHAVSKETFIICKCQNCSLLFTNPRPKEEKIGPYYDFPEYYSHEKNNKNLTQLIYNKVRNYAVLQKVKLISELKEPGKLLDYGCGTGEFLQAAQLKGWTIKGIEPTEKARNQANQILDGKVLENIELLEDKKKFDIITLFHVLEHIHTLRKTTKKIIKRLKSDGYILIAVPNPTSFDALKYRENWAGWDVPRHLYHFDETAITNFEQIFDLDLVRTVPMPFDSYYVSLLSEGYTKPKQNLISKYLKAVKSGWDSNKIAKGHSGKYSSNLFIFKKK
ncbi:class I SAM-dependent methyltransferase [Algoriphagus pacificus]|uniref:Class I SAM-dependent methyltransferase n=1 Tax=Algoriphagus pacificus TaxID=2811234 RepID=A0ABS3CE07_9BACT|nr:class I SAM-dependent methyltransferase [Algoriphagus pacificus]MBN7814396.1 class I SAM-dependent methyltransferase [Algoriphagus pacificus]